MNKARVSGVENPARPHLDFSSSLGRFFHTNLRPPDHNDDADHRASESIQLGGAFQRRSEEHTSELQSLRHLVCRLLLLFRSRSEAHTSELQSLRHLACRRLLETTTGTGALAPAEARTTPVTWPSTRLSQR